MSDVILEKNKLVTGTMLVVENNSFTFDRPFEIRFYR